jgi:hypothetical protein
VTALRAIQKCGGSLDFKWQHFAFLQHLWTADFDRSLAVQIIGETFFCSGANYVFIVFLTILSECFSFSPLSVLDLALGLERPETKCSSATWLSQTSPLFSCSLGW